MKNKISILLLLCFHLGVAQSESEEFTYFKINRKSQELGGLIKCFEVGPSEQEDLNNDEQFSPFFWNLGLKLLQNKDNMTVQISAPIGSEHRLCSRNVEEMRNFITLQKNAEQALFNQVGFQLRSETICIVSENEDSNVIFTMNKSSGQIESKKKAVIQEGETFAIALPCRVIAAVIYDKNVSNAELGYRAANMLRSGEGEYHCENFSMRLTRLTEENGPGAITSIKDFFPTNKSK